jgi:proteasome lid subunit RPN8/RPN11
MIAESKVQEPEFDSFKSKPFSQCRHNPEVIKEHPRAAVMDRYLVFTSASDFSAYLPNSLVDRAMAMADAASPREFIGLCAGNVFSDDEGCYSVLTGIVPDTAAVASPGSVHTTTDSEYSTRKLLSVLYPDCIPLGWCHSHLGIGAFFSGIDKENQTTWKKPYHLGIVIDPIRHELAVFRGPEAEKLSRADDENPREGPTSVCKEYSSFLKRSARFFNRALSRFRR